MLFFMFFFWYVFRECLHQFHWNLFKNSFVEFHRKFQQLAICLGFFQQFFEKILPQSPWRFCLILFENIIIRKNS